MSRGAWFLAMPRSFAQLGSGRHGVLRAALPARHRRGGLLPRRAAVPELLVSVSPEPCGRAAARGEPLSFVLGAPVSGAIMRSFGGATACTIGSGCSCSKAIPRGLGGGLRALLPRRRACRTRTWLAPSDEKRWLAERSRARRRRGCTRERHTLGEVLQGRARARVRARSTSAWSSTCYGISFWVCRDRRPDRRAQRRRRRLRDRDPVRGRDRRAGADRPPLRPHGRAQAARRRSRCALGAAAFAPRTDRLARRRDRARWRSACSSCSARTRRVLGDASRRC